MISPMIEIRLSVERMRHTIVQAIGSHSAELETAIQENVEKALAEFDWYEEIRRTAEQELRRIVNNAVSSAIYQAMESPDVKAALASIAAEKIKQSSLF